METALQALLGSEFFLVATTASGTIDFAEKIMAFLGFAEDLDASLKKLLDTPLDTGIRNLNYAKNSSVDSIKYIDAAIQKFTEALNLEEYERLVCAYLGLAFCFHLKADIENFKQILEEFSKKDIDVFENLTPIERIRASSPFSSNNSKRKLLHIRYLIFQHSGFSEFNPFVPNLKRKERNKNVRFLEYVVKVLKPSKFLFQTLEVPILHSLYERQLEIAKLQDQAKKQIEDYDKYPPDMETVINYRKKISMI